ncbi:hypothetical protein C7449_104130 [Mycoplana dimorpha]|uniref:Uncharacterized protein n=1 Tax=Mycoplana dimorpha TaxID=28320 RepID=A0A2T5B7Y6_MYCDI|nr:hypothetical protein C7449_104130 [Mycoplana dimorpha]
MRACRPAICSSTRLRRNRHAEHPSFRAGRHTSSSGQTLTFTERDLDAIAASYDPRTHEAPIVVGHPKTDAPAYGWIERVIAKSDGLHAIPRQVNAEFSELVQQGAYKKVSAAFYPANAANNPKPGAPYLRHVGFLGAEPPAVKGLSAVQFSEGEALLFAEEDMIALREHSITARERQYRRREIEDTFRRIQKEGRLPIGLLPERWPLPKALANPKASSSPRVTTATA